MAAQAQKTFSAGGFVLGDEQAPHRFSARGNKEYVGSLLDLHLVEG